MGDDNKLYNADAYRTSDGKFYLASELTTATYHTFSKECTDKYVIAYYYKDSIMDYNYNGVLDGSEIQNGYYITRIVCYNMNFCNCESPYVSYSSTIESYTLINCKTYDESIKSKFQIQERICKKFICY